MQIKYILSALSLAVAAAADGDFMSICTSVDLSEGHSLTAVCPGDGFKKRSHLDLNKRYATIEDGSIVPRRDGGYYGRCNNCAVTYKGILACTCKQGDGLAKTVMVDLNERISNVNGYIHCDVSDGDCDGQCGW